MGSAARYRHPQGEDFDWNESPARFYHKSESECKEPNERRMYNLGRVLPKRLQQGREYQRTENKCCETNLKDCRRGLILASDVRLTRNQCNGYAEK